MTSNESNASAERSVPDAGQRSETADQTGERAKGREASAFRPDRPSAAFQEGQDAALLGQALNPYRRAVRALSDPGSLETLGKLAQQWEDGYVSNSK